MPLPVLPSPVGFAGGDAEVLPPLVNPALNPALVGGASTAATGANPSANKSSKARRDLLMFALAVVLVCAGGFGGFLYFSVSGQPDAQASSSNTPPSAAAATAGDTVASGATSVNVALPQATANAVLPITPDEASAAAELAKAETATAAPRSFLPATADVAEGKAAPAANLPPRPSARFAQYAKEVSISGVFQGNPPRALLNGRVVRVGDVVEPNFGVTFVGLDPEKKQLILRETSGAEIRVRY
ncbi:MAG: hypothetical protein EAZ36_03115 [Verrucomicrobia bacterium]|nr:MAG: hypothetical protein EAZ36_03115 [Verrucomicrobiota bacterium]